MDAQENEIADERTRLLDEPTIPRKKVPTPLPKLQLGIVLLLQICEPITSQSIYPYINQLISELDITGGDERKVGYYAGLIESLFFATEAVTVLQWGRVSDHLGRKPVLLVGLFGIVLSMLSFGLSRTFLMLVISRCLTGLLNGNIGVMKSVMGELTDSSNRAEGFAFMPVVWGFGATIGPLIGGSLSRPHERFPKYFSGEFWKTYPYFLPSLVTSSYVLFSFILTLLLFKETLPKRKSQECTLEDRQPNGSKSSPSRTRDTPVPLRELLTYPVVLSVSNYVCLAFLGIAFSALFPLFLAMPLEIGGLDLDPPLIGLVIGSYGAGGAVFQGFFFSKAVRYFGERRIFIICVSTFLPIFCLLPAMNMAARAYGQKSTPVCILGLLVLAIMAANDMAYGTIFMFVTASAPNKRSLGATNGLSQTTVSIARAIGPALATSLFSLSVEKNILHGYAVYAFFAGVACFAVWLATRLPKKVWEDGGITAIDEN